MEFAKPIVISVMEGINGNLDLFFLLTVFIAVIKLTQNCAADAGGILAAESRSQSPFHPIRLT